MECENNCDALCTTVPHADSLNWGKAPSELTDTHLEEVKQMVAKHR
jgi:hypothetical protein